MATKQITTCDSCHEEILHFGYRVHSHDMPDHDVHALCLGVEIDGRVLSGTEPAVVVSRFMVEKVAA